MNFPEYIPEIFGTIIQNFLKFWSKVPEIVGLWEKIVLELIQNFEILK